MNGRLKDRLQAKPIDKINIVSLTDVLLTLLVFFLFIESSRFSGAFSFDTASEAAAAKPVETKIVKINITSSGISIAPPQGTPYPVEKERLRTELKKQFNPELKTRVVINAEKTIKYKDIITVMDEAKTAGFNDISLVGTGKNEQTP